MLAGYQPMIQPVQRAPVELVTPEDLRNAIAMRQIVPFYQPKVSIEDRSMTSAEVLARWRHPERGLVPPIAFISVAEEHLLIDELTQVICEQAVADLGRWHRAGHRFSLGVNLSADSLNRVGLPEQLARLLQGQGIGCESITLEVTESRLMQNLTTALDVLTRLRLKGFGLSVDDFGTGYSSMSQLSNIPFTELKIDRAFVHGGSCDPAARAILESSAALARKLNMVIVAEGVEDQADWDLVRDVGCHLVQGHFIARPMPAGEFEAWVEQNEPALQSV